MKTPKIRLQSAKLVLSTAALKDSMKTEQPQSKEEIIKEFLHGFLTRAGKELGYTDPGGE